MLVVVSGYALLQISTDVIFLKGNMTKEIISLVFPNVERNCMESKKTLGISNERKYYDSLLRVIIIIFWPVAICENDGPFFEIINLSSLILCEMASCMGQENLL